MREKGEEMVRDRVSVRMETSAGFRKFLRELAIHEQRSMTCVVQRATESYAKEIGFRRRFPEK